MDLIVTTRNFPNSGETVIGAEFATAPGGKGANQAVQAAKLGANVALMAKVGKDAFGEDLISAATACGVNTSQIIVSNTGATAVSNILLETSESGACSNRIITVPGVAETFSKEDVSPLEKTIKSYDLVMLQLEIPIEVSREVARIAAKHQIPVMLNPAPAAELDAEFLKNITYLTPNEHEASLMTGIPINRDDHGIHINDVISVAQALRNKGVKNVLITLGENGAAMLNDDGFNYEGSVPNVFAVDPTAAGDSFVAAYAVAVCSGCSPAEAMKFANATASITVSRKGAQPSLPTLEEVELLAKL